MKLLRTLQQEWAFYRSLYKQEIGTEMCQKLIEKREFAKLRKVFKVRWLPDDLWKKLLDCADDKTIKCYLAYYLFPSQVCMLLKFSDDDLKRINMNNWVERKLAHWGITKNDYILLADHASGKLQNKMRNLRKIVKKFNYFLADSYLLWMSPINMYFENDINFHNLRLSQRVCLFAYEKAPKLINEMLFDDTEAEELISLNSETLVDTWLSANLVREKVLQLRKTLRKIAKPYLSDKTKKLLLEKGCDLAKYNLL